MNLDPDYSAAYVIIRTDKPGDVEGHGFVFTIGRGNEVEIAAIKAAALHDVRWGEEFDGQFVWVYEISGSVPASHLGGWQNAEGWRQSPVFFPAGGSTINGISMPGEVVISRVFIAEGILQVDIFRGSVIELPEEETLRRKNATNPEWPIAHVVLHDVSRDQFMGRHRANHAQMVYAPDAETAMFDRMGIKVNLVGAVNGL